MSERRVRVDRERLKVAREKAGMNQAELAAAVGLSRSVLSHVEYGDRMVREPMLNALARALNVTVAWLLGAQEPPASPGGPDPFQELIDELRVEYIRGLDAVEARASALRAAEADARERLDDAFRRARLAGEEYAQALRKEVLARLRERQNPAVVPSVLQEAEAGLRQQAAEVAVAASEFIRSVDTLLRPSEDPLATTKEPALISPSPAMEPSPVAPASISPPPATELSPVAPPDADRPPRSAIVLLIGGRGAPHPTTVEAFRLQLGVELQWIDIPKGKDRGLASMAERIANARVLGVLILMKNISHNAKDRAQAAARNASKLVGFPASAGRDTLLMKAREVMTLAPETPRAAGRPQ